MIEGVMVVVMAYNESASLERVVGEIYNAVWALRRPFELLVIDDGSTDDTGVVADRIAESVPEVRVVHHRSNGGLGAVYRTGFDEARQDFVTFFPADGQFPASIIATFVPLMAEVDMLLGYLPSRGGSWIARGLSAAERALYAVLFGRVPRFQGVLMFRRTILDAIELRSKGRGWAIIMELIIRAARRGLRLRSVPTPIRPRLAGASKVQNLRTILSNLRQVLELWRQLIAE